MRTISFVRGTVAAMLAPLLLFAVVLTTACPKAKPAVPVSHQVKVARAFPVGYVALQTGASIIEILADAGEVDKAFKDEASRATDSVGKTLDMVRARISSGQWDRADIEALLNAGADDLKKLVADGDLRVKNPAAKARWTDWASTAQFTVNSVSAVVKALKPPNEPPTPAINADAQSLSQMGVFGSAQITAVVAVSTQAAVKIFAYREQSDIPNLWQAAQNESDALHAANKRRLGG